MTVDTVQLAFNYLSSANPHFDLAKHVIHIVVALVKPLHSPYCALKCLECFHYCTTMN